MICASNVCNRHVYYINPCGCKLGLFVNTNQISGVIATVDWEDLTVGLRFTEDVLLLLSPRSFQISARKSVFVPCLLIFSDAAPLAHECFPLRYLNCSSFVVNVPTVCYFLLLHTGQQKDCLGITKGMHWRESVEYSWTWQLSRPHYGIHELWI